ncbi:DUF6221 family protein [Nocardioides sp. Root1257]|uniref:DUF6221 family protein n=1 Tax=unclassified Nocardioides TaxID=2615069 RepID=UPI0039DFDAC7
MRGDPADFLSARLTEDEERVDSLLLYLEALPRLEPASATTSAVEISWSADPGHHDHFLRLHPNRVEVWFREDPRRLEHDLSARRQIAADHRATDGGACAICVETLAERPRPVTYPCPTLCRLTWRYADHPDYNDSWNDS